MRYPAYLFTLLTLLTMSPIVQSALPLNSLTSCRSGNPSSYSSISPNYLVPLVELYTSEGCSSCPPADKWLSQLGQNWRSKIVPLSIHVDYWNYLGWADPYSNPAFTKRQRKLAQRNQSPSIYTPEVFVAGYELVAGRRNNDPLNWINTARKTAVTNTIQLTWGQANQGQHSVEIKINSSDDKTKQLNVVLYQNGLSQSVTRGENQGELLKHDFVVRYWHPPLALQKREETFTVNLPIPNPANPYGVAAFVEDIKTGEILQSWASDANSCL